MVYEPREDSYLLKKHVEEYAQGRVLDMGSGSGILAQAAKKNSCEVMAADIDPEAVEVLRAIPGLEVIQSDLFSEIDGDFDTIIFNPPYLPDHPQAKDIALDGGKQGFETIGRFLSQAIEHLRVRGRILLLFSNLTNRRMVDFLIEKNLLTSTLLEEKPVGFFEKLYVYKIEFSGLFRKVTGQGVKDLRYFTRGHRGILFHGKLDSDLVVIKTSLRESQAIDRMANERRYLSILNRHGIGPNLLSGDEEYIMYEYVEGITISEYIEDLSSDIRQDMDSILRKVFEQCREMDRLLINKEEMHHPVKHIIITPELRPVMIDFERANHTIKPKNVTQFLQFLISANQKERLSQAGYSFSRDELIRAAAAYKHDMSDENFKRIMSLVLSPHTNSSS
jgi:release factor glutamine methyltransferase